jgi:hypothetical protein
MAPGLEMPEGLQSHDAPPSLAVLASPLAGFRDRLVAFVLDIILVALATGSSDSVGFGGGRWSC